MASGTVTARSAEEPGGFLTGSTIDVRQLDDKFWVTLEPLVYQGETQRFVVPKGQRTDFASVPRPFVWFLPRYGRYTKAAVLHDYLWSEAVPAGLLSRADADGIFRRAMRELKVPFLRRWIMWSAVRWGALAKADGRRGWLADSWRVLLYTVVALAIVAPAAVVILLTLPVFALLELAGMAAAAGQPADSRSPSAAGQAGQPAQPAAEDLIGGQMDSLVLQTALGLVFLFAVFAALASVLTELVTRFAGLRREYLLRGIRTLVDGPGPLPAGPA